MALQEDNDETGDVISVNGQATTTAKEDRGDDFAPPTAGDGADTQTVDGNPPPADLPETPKEEPKPQHIPKSRFDEVNNRKNELAEQLLEAQSLIESLRAPAQPARTDATPAFDEDAKEAEYVEALIEGDTAKAVGIRKEINTHIRAQANQEFESRQAHTQALSSLQAASDQAVVDFPYLDTDEGAEALELIMASRDSKIARGIAPAEALRSAVATIAPKFAPAPSDTPSKALPLDKVATDTRTAAALARGAADSNLQPPSVQAGVGNRAAAGRVNVSEMTEEQFENLSSADKKRLRGDV